MAAAPAISRNISSSALAGERSSSVMPSPSLGYHIINLS
jgi:hypothetical protein